MRKSIFTFSFVIFLMLFPAGCTYLHTANTTAVKDMQSDLMKISQSVYSVKVTWIFNQFNIDVFLRDIPKEQVKDSIFDRVKAFTTIDTIEGISSSATEVNYRLYVNNNKTDPYLFYSTRYYNTNDQTDRSPGNINGYKCWTGGIVTPEPTQSLAASS
jgi:hypothetical protein